MVFLFTAHLAVLKRSTENGNLLVREYSNPHKISLKFSAINGTEIKNSKVRLANKNHLSMKIPVVVVINDCLYTFEPLSIFGWEKI